MNGSIIIQMMRIVKRESATFLLFCKFFYRKMQERGCVKYELAFHTAPCRSFKLECPGIELIIGALFREKLFVVAALDDPSVVEDHDDVGVSHR